MDIDDQKGVLENTGAGAGDSRRVRPKRDTVGLARKSGKTWRLPASRALKTSGGVGRSW